MVNVTLNTKSRSCIASSIFLGYEGENQANKLVFSFDDEFVDGSAQLNIKRGNDNGYVALIKVGETYELEVKSSLVSKIGDVTFQLQVSKSDGTIYKFDTFIMTVKDAIDSDIPLPEDYPTWQEAISTALAEMDNINISIDKVDTTTTVSVTDKKGAITEVEIHDGADGADGKDGKDGADGANGKDGKDGFSPIATVTQTDTGATISITDTNGTTIATVKNGKDGSSGILEETDPVYLADKPNIALKRELPTKVSELENDSKFISSYTETDPVYSSEKSTLALKSELPTKLSQLQNDSEFISSYTETDPTIPTHVKNITQENITNWNNKSEFSGSYNDLTDKPTIPSVEGLATTEQLAQGLATKQDTLTPGDNITIENGVISASGGGSSGGVSEWEKITTDISTQNFDNSILQLTISTNLTSKINKGTKLKYKDSGDTKYGIIVDYDSTNLYVFCGQYTINGNVSNLEYSNMYSPVGFPTDKNLWKVEVQNSNMYFVKNPGHTQIYNLGDISITIPRGVWDLMFQVCYQIGLAGSASNAKYMTVGLGEDTSSFKTEYTSACAGYSAFIRDTTTKDCGVLTLDNAKTFYFNERNDGIEQTAGLGMPIYLLNNETKLIIRATSIYV